MKNLNNTLVFASIFMVIGFLTLSILSSPVNTNALKINENYEDNAKYNEKLNTGNKDIIIQKSCGNSFLSKNKGGLLSQDVLSALNMYLSQNPVAIGDEPLTDVKNVDGLCVLINLVKSESTEGRIANEEQIRNILNAALQDNSNNLPAINGIIKTLIDLNLIEPSDD